MLWRRVIAMIHGCEWGGWCTNSVTSTYGVSLWKSIRHGWPTLLHYIQYDAGDGTCVRFWQDQWCGESPLAVCYPELFQISSEKEVSVADHMRFNDGFLHWEVHFTRAVQDWELESLKLHRCYLWGIGVFFFGGVGVGTGEDRIY